ncbi:ribosome maturation factor RimM [Gaiella sp.]|uniref:ribosome maturation factor RimM n=1 Tax=Gaiella sp. TaxID=2663207 RepID=UPI0039838A7C
MPVGRVGRPHGLDGAFVVEQGSDDPCRFAVGAELHVDGVSAKIVVSRRVGRGRHAIRLDRAVERGTTLTVLRGALPPLPAGEFYAFEIIGLRVEEVGGRQCGIVKDLLPGPANDNLELDDGTLVPMIEDAISAIDPAGGVVLLNPGFIV